MNLVKSIFGNRSDERVIRRSLENPDIPLSQLDEDAWLWPALTGGKSDSGVSVSHKSALTYIAFWRSVNLISQAIAKIPAYVYRRLPGDEGREKDKKHPAYRLLLRQPNSYTKAYDFKASLQAHALTYGNGYGFIRRQGNGVPVAIVQLPPDKITPMLENGNPVYVYRDPSVTKPIMLPGEDVLHIRGLGFDGLTGYDVVTYAKETLGLGMAARKFGSVYFKNRATGGVILTYPGKLSDMAYKQVRDSWERMYSGLDAAHKTQILEEGMEAKPLSHDAQKAQLNELRQFEIREIANILGVPPHKIGDTTRTGYASLEQENQAFLDDTLDPWLRQWEEEAWAKLLSEDEKDNDSHYIEFQRNAFVRADLESRTRSYARYLEWGVFNRDKVLEKENENPIPDGMGKKYMVPLHMQFVGQDGKLEPPPTAPTAQAAPSQDVGRPKRNIDSLIDDVCGRICKRIGLHAAKAARSPENYMDWLEQRLDAHKSVCVEMVEPLMEWRHGNKDAGSLAMACVNKIFDIMNEELLRAADAQPKQLTSAVSTALGRARERCERELERMLQE